MQVWSIYLSCAVTAALENCPKESCNYSSCNWISHYTKPPPSLFSCCLSQQEVVIYAQKQMSFLKNCVKTCCLVPIILPAQSLKLLFCSIIRCTLKWCVELQRSAFNPAVSSMQAAWKGHKNDVLPPDWFSISPAPLHLNQFIVQQWTV